MLEIRKKRFLDSLDTVQLISRPAKEGFGEDSSFCSKCGKSAIVSVYDGCGGLGSKKYASFEGHTGAYLASRVVSGAVCDWYHANYRRSWVDPEKLSQSINRYIAKGYETCKPYLTEKTKIRGSMVRDLPTTMALAYTENANEGILLHTLWAGDSRVYLLDSDGLAQLTLDDAYVEDALENLRNDSPMTNVLSSDGNYVINYKTFSISKPALVFAATDGCFAYLSTPMDFEYLILKSISESETPEQFRKLLRKMMAHYAGDDLTFALLSFFYGDFINTKKMLHERLRFLRENYINVLESDQTDVCIKRLWAKYKPNYERYLHEQNEAR